MERFGLNENLCKDNETLAEENNILVITNNRLIPKVTEFVEQHDDLEQVNAKLTDGIARPKMQKVGDADFVKCKADIERYFPDLSDLLT